MLNKKKNLLSVDQIEKLQKETNSIKIGLTSEEILKSRCTHRTADGEADSLIFDPKTGIARCSICGRTFKPIDPDKIENIQEHIDFVISLIESMKLLNASRETDEAYAEMYQIVPMLDKLPELFKLSVKDFNKIDIQAPINQFQMFPNLSQALGTINLSAKSTKNIDTEMFDQLEKAHEANVVNNIENFLKEGE